MTKQELQAKVADRAGMTKVDAAKGEKVTWTGFGTFEVRPRKPRMGRNPQTGAPLHIPASKTPAFKAGKGLKDAVK
ncbi:MAG: Histone family protein DNA-binding protein [candidate division WWE3 bacterium GW2011_GWC2_44_85]|nr:MAG: Histone family protein DNA-binding protein [candidate division WWE3 bacterium GW2011_GWC2_44_85]